MAIGRHLVMSDRNHFARLVGELIEAVRMANRFGPHGHLLIVLPDEMRGISTGIEHVAIGTVHVCGEHSRYEIAFEFQRLGIELRSVPMQHDESCSRWIDQQMIEVVPGVGMRMSIGPWNRRDVSRARESVRPCRFPDRLARFQSPAALDCHMWIGKPVVAVAGTKIVDPSKIDGQTESSIW